MAIDNTYFEGMVNQIYPPELKLNKTNVSDTEVPFSDQQLSVSTGYVQQNFMTSAMILILTWQLFPFSIVIFPVVSLMGFSFHILFGLLESAVM